MCFHSYVKISFLGRDPFWKGTKEFEKQPQYHGSDDGCQRPQLTWRAANTVSLQRVFDSSAYYQAFTANCIREIPFISTTRWVQVDMGFEPMAAG